MDTRLRRGNRTNLAIYLAMGSRSMAGKLKAFIGIILAGILLSLSACDTTPTVKKLPPNAIVVAFGDSLTVGVGANSNESYPAILEQLIQRKVINAGISGETSDAGLARLPDVLQEYSPQLLIICHGGNDFLQRKAVSATESNIRAMVELAKSKNIDVVLVSVPEFNLWAQPPALYEYIARQYQLPIDNNIIGKLEKSADMKSDQIHFNAKGYHAMATAIHQLLIESQAVDN